jgi:hypothetical protein
MKAIPIAAGETFGRWTTLEDSRIGKRAMVPCRCECGTEKWPKRCTSCKEAAA